MFSLPYALQSWGAVATWTGDNERPRGLISEGSRSSEISDVSKSGLRKAKSHQEMGGLSWHAEVENRMDNYLSNDKICILQYPYTHIHLTQFVSHRTAYFDGQNVLGPFAFVRNHFTRLLLVIAFFFPEGLSSIVKKFKKLSKVEMRPISQEHQSIPERRWSSFYPFQCKNLSTKIWKSCWRQPSKSLGLGYRVWLQSGDAEMEGEITTYKARRPSSDTKVGRIGMCSPGLACVFYVTWVCM